MKKNVKNSSIERTLSLISLFLLFVGAIGFLFSLLGTAPFAGWMLTFGFLLSFAAALLLLAANFKYKGRNAQVAGKINEIATGNISIGVIGKQSGNGDETDRAIQNLLDYLNEKASLIDKV